MSPTSGGVEVASGDAERGNCEVRSSFGNGLSRAAAHADHFHMEIKPGVRWFLYH
jgi:hypothetical protein